MEGLEKPSFELVGMAMVGGHVYGEGIIDGGCRRRKERNKKGNYEAKCDWCVPYTNFRITSPGQKR